MAPVRIPEGSVFVARQRGENVAADLLAAAEQVGADRVASVRTTTGGYHVFEEVADQYQANRGDAGKSGKSGKTDEEKAAKAAKKAAEKQAKADAAAAAAGDAGKTGDDTGNEGDEGNGNEPEPLPVTAESSNAEIDDYAADQNPAVDLSSAKNRVEKIALLEAARAPKTPDAE